MTRLPDLTGLKTGTCTVRDLELEDLRRWVTVSGVTGSLAEIAQISETRKRLRIETPTGPQSEVVLSLGLDTEVLIYHDMIDPDLWQEAMRIVDRAKQMTHKEICQLADRQEQVHTKWGPQNTAAHNRGHRVLQAFGMGVGRRKVNEAASEAVRYALRHGKRDEVSSREISCRAQIVNRLNINELAMLAVSFAAEAVLYRSWIVTADYPFWVYPWHTVFGPACSYDPVDPPDLNNVEAWVA